MPSGTFEIWPMRDCQRGPGTLRPLPFCTAWRQAFLRSILYDTENCSKINCHAGGGYILFIEKVWHTNCHFTGQDRSLSHFVCYGHVTHVQDERPQKPLSWLSISIAFSLWYIIFVLLWIHQVYVHNVWFIFSKLLPHHLLMPRNWLFANEQFILQPSCHKLIFHSHKQKSKF